MRVMRLGFAEIGMTTLRGEGMAKRSERLAKLRKGPGIFRYTGGAFDTECVPTVRKTGKQEPVLNDAGMPVFDSSGRQVFQPAGAPVRDFTGRPVLGGIPEMKRIPIQVREVRGIKFPIGEAVEVESASIALKLRAMAHFEELEAMPDEEPGQEPVADGEEAPKPKRGRPRKTESVEG